MLVMDLVETFVVTGDGSHLGKILIVVNLRPN